jgi:uncharacterized protein (DUF1800 family)
MRSGPGKLALFLLCLGLACAVPQLIAKKKDKEKIADSGRVEQRRAVHALNRLTFGPRPGDAQQVLEMGVEQWIDLQLHPDKIRDSAVESRLAAFRTLRMSSKEIVEEFPDQQMIRAVMDGKKPMPSDPARRAVFQVQIARMQEKKERKAEAASGAGAAPGPNNAGPAPQAAVESAGSMAPNGANAGTENASGASADTAAANGLGNETTLSAASGNDNTMSPPAVPGADEMKPAPPEDPAAARRRKERLYADLSIQQLVDVPAEQRYKKILAMSTDEQLALADSLRGGKGLEFLAGMDAKKRETLLAMNNPQGVVMEELVQAKLLRAIYSERQLEEVMTDFWFNHFNVYANKGADRLLLTTYEQEVIRPRALGKFEDLLVATAKSPAMLFYLDNWLSVGPDSAQALGIPARPGGPYGPWGRRYPPRAPRPNAKRKQNSGLNENYGRELLELHTLSVNGGYSQRDVTEVAKVFTGWTIEKPFEGGGFRYDPRRHEPGPKFVLGHRIKPKGEDEGREVLHRLATSPQTAHFISLKLAQRFVSDEPPAELVDRMAKTFLKKKGEIREVLTTLFHSPEFWDDQTHRAKVKTPLEFVASAVRATGAEVEDALPLTRQLNNMGMPLYGAQPPTGYSMKAETWVSSSALLNRMNFAVALTSGKVRGVKVDTVALAGSGAPSGDAPMALSAMEVSLLAGEVSKQTHDSITAEIEGAGKNGQQKQDSGKHAEGPRAADVSVIAGLLLGSPEFQRR